MNKNILITGCSSGIGLCVAEGLHKRGYQVFATARNKKDVKALQAKGLESLWLDLDDSNSIKAATREVFARTDNQLYALFNNGAYGQPGAVEDLSRAALREQFETNVFGWQELTNYVLPVMRQQGYGRIIQNSSILGFVTMQYRGAYCASKFAIEGLTDTLRIELRDTNIQTILIEPGPIESSFRKNAQARFEQSIDVDKSAYRDKYILWDQKLKAGKTASKSFVLPADAVLKTVIHALESKKPKLRYRVTTPTHLFAFLKRILTTRQLDYLLSKII